MKKKQMIRYGVYCVSLLLLTILCDLGLSFREYERRHTPLYIKTFDGSDQPYHPSVLFFKNGWHGYRYWMAETPYPVGAQPYRSRWECPSVHVSNDGIRWHVPPGSNNPIDNLTEDAITRKDYFSDPDLVFRNGILECWYRVSEHLTKEKVLQTVIVRKTSVDGVHWSQREECAGPFFQSYEKKYAISLSSDSMIADGGINEVCYSPAVIWLNNVYKMWYVYGNSNKACVVSHSRSEDGKKWEKRKECHLRGYDLVQPWHIDVCIQDNIYYLLIYGREGDLTLWQSVDGELFDFVKVMLRPDHYVGSFYSLGLYRSCLIRDDQGWKMYFSASASHKTTIGLMEGSCLAALEVKDGIGHADSLSDFIYKYQYKWRERISTIKTNLLLF